MGRKERAAETEAALKAAAQRVFAERGYLNTKITDITAEAGRAAGSFYNHFAGKEELLEALLADLAAEGDAAASRDGHLGDFTDPAAVRWHVAAYVRVRRTYAATLRAVREAALVSPEFAEKAARFGAEQRADVRGHLDGLAAAGLTLPAPPDLALGLAFASVDHLLDNAEALAADLTEDELIDAATRYVYRGLTGRDC